MADVQTDDVAAIRKELEQIRSVLTFAAFFAMLATLLLAAWLFGFIEVELRTP